MAAPPAHAGWSSYPVDDSMSRTVPANVELRWRDAVPGRDTQHLLGAVFALQARLDVAAWVGRTARVYMAMPVTPQSTLSIQWAGSGTLSSGRLSGGQRHLVYQGVIPGPVLEDLLRVEVLADSRDAVQPRTVQFNFIIEVQTP